MSIKSNSIVILSLILIWGCAGHKTSHRSKTPTAQIKDYKYKTQRNLLDQVIKNEKIVSNNQSFLKPVHNTRVKFWLNYFKTKNKERLERFYHNGERYRKIVEEVFAKYGLPADLFYVGIIESGFQNRARSHAGAVGPWQFIKGTAQRYGLKVTHSIDERKNIYKSTEAAALYFQDLYNIFGSWELALAAYNAGEYGVIRRIRGANTRDYYELCAQRKLPKETRNYVPKVLAAMEILKNPKRYGLTSPNVDDDFFQKAAPQRIYQATNIATLARQLKVSRRELNILNPDIHLGHIPYMGKKGFEIYVPTSAYQGYLKANPYLKKNKRFQYSRKTIQSNKKQNTHIVRKSESLYSIAKRYDITISQLKALNHLRRSKIYPGQVLKLLSEQITRVKYSYIVKKGDNLKKIANIFKTKSRKLKKLNRLKRSRIFPGQKLKVPAYKVKQYTVRKGDHLTKIAKITNTSIRRLKRYNNISRAIYPGQKLIVSIHKI